MILLIVEFVVGLLMLSPAWTNMGWAPGVAVGAVWIGLTAWQIMQLKKADDEAVKSKIKRRIAPAMPVPLSVPVIMILRLVFTLL